MQERKKEEKKEYKRKEKWKKKWRGKVLRRQCDAEKRGSGKRE